MLNGKWLWRRIGEKMEKKTSLCSVKIKSTLSDWQTTSSCVHHYSAVQWCPLIIFWISVRITFLNQVFGTSVGYPSVGYPSERASVSVWAKERLSLCLCICMFTYTFSFSLFQFHLNHHNSGQRLVHQLQQWLNLLFLAVWVCICIKGIKRNTCRCHASHSKII